MPGVTGESYARVLRVDLTKGKCEHESLDEATVRKYLGGCSLGTKYLYDEVPPEVQWSDPRNLLMVLSGPLCGTQIPGAGGVTVSGKGPMTGGVASTQAMGVIGAYMRFCGLLGIVMKGAAERWSYLVVDENGNGQLKDARHLVGKDTWETVDIIRQELGKGEHDVSIQCIGPAGEHLVRFAAMISDKGHVAAHNGVGAVMGSKRLKAIAVMRGKQRTAAKNPAKILEIAKGITEPAKANPKSIYYFGTLNGVHGNYANGMLPVKNYTTAVWDIPEDQFGKFTGAYINEHFQPKRSNPCWACPNHHCTMLTITEGPYKGMTLEEPEYEQLSAFSANLGINEVTSVLMLCNTVDRLGLDTNEAGWVLGMVMESFQRGILTGSDTDGLELVWGNAEGARELLKRIATRQGLGDTLAEGAKRASQKIGRGMESLAIYTMKGGTPRGHDHRARWTEMFDTCVSDSGALDNTPISDLTQFGLPPKLSPFDPDMLAKAEGKMKGSTQFEDSLVTCRFNTRGNVNWLADALAAATGWDFTWDEGMTVGRRAVNTMRAYNIRCGITSDLDRPSPRYGSTAPDGPAAGKAIAPHFENMLKQYYELMGWDSKGVPTAATLKSLGLEKQARDLGLKAA